ncbi:hypothetical protein E4U53_001295 [Claviceps sorghi]|nr:hypothetical protein E4U53_001295 [Claviceps sorghi]
MVGFNEILAAAREKGAAAYCDWPRKGVADLTKLMPIPDDVGRQGKDVKHFMSRSYRESAQKRYADILSQRTPAQWERTCPFDVDINTDLFPGAGHGAFPIRDIYKLDMSTWNKGKEAPNRPQLMLHRLISPIPKNDIKGHIDIVMKGDGWKIQEINWSRVVASRAMVEKLRGVTGISASTVNQSNQKAVRSNPSTTYYS